MPDENPLPKELNSWETAQRALSVKFSWLQEVLSKKVDSEIKNTCVAVLTNALNAAKAQAGPTYDPFQVESLLAEVSESLDRCLALRKEVLDYETLATQFALDYQLFEDQIKHLESLENTQQTKCQRDAEAKGQKKANEIFVRDLSTLPAGFAAMAEGAAKSASIAAAWETAKQRHVDGKWNGLKDHWSILIDRHLSDGCALNFGQRKERSLEILVDEFRSTYGKSLAAEVGLERIFSISYPKSSVAAIDSLDELVRWARSIIDQLYRYNQDESTFELVVPLTRSFKLKDVDPGNAGPGDAGRVDYGEYKKQMDDRLHGGIFDLDISPAIPPYMKHLRLKGIGLSFAWNEERPGQIELATIGPDAYRHSLSAVVIPPEQGRLRNGAQAGLSTNKDVPRAGMIISRFSLFDPKQGVEFFFAPSINNINPRGVNDEGKWHICVGAIDDYPNTGSFWRTASSMFDIRLHLRMSGKVDSSQVKASEIW